MNANVLFLILLKQEKSKNVSTERPEGHVFLFLNQPSWLCFFSHQTL